MPEPVEMEFIENRSQDETDIRQADDDGRSTAYFIATEPC